MKWFSKAAVGGLLWLTFSAAFGSTLNITALTENVDDGGQFLANLGNPAQSFYVYCVDYRNGESTPATVNLSTPNMSVSPYDGLADTRYGTTPTANFAFDNGNPSSGAYTLSAVDRYVQAAWLTTQFNFTSGVTTSDDQIQNAIWTLLSTNGTSQFPFGDVAGVGTWITQAVNWETNAAAMKTLAAFESTVVIYTSTDVAPNLDLNNADPGNRYVVGTQEMIGTTSTPEPATLAMMGAGLLTLGLLRKRIKP